MLQKMYTNEGKKERMTCWLSHDKSPSDDIV